MQIGKELVNWNKVNWVSELLHAEVVKISPALDPSDSPDDSGMTDEERLKQNYHYFWIGAGWFVLSVISVTVFVIMNNG